MITREAFTSAVLQNALTVRGYMEGCDGRSGSGQCDCIGLVIGALKILGMKWPGTHGTNWTARHYAEGMEPLTAERQLKIGDMVFKSREPGAPGYKLPDTYRSDPDQRDYYHVGVVTNLSPVTITHCTDVKGGIRRDSQIKYWQFRARLSCVKEDGESMSKIAAVFAEKGNTVNLRAQPSKTARVIAEVPVKSEVEVLEEGAEWCRIAYKEKTGFMMTQFLIIVGENTPPPEEPGETDPQEPEDGDMVWVSMKKVEELRRIAQEALDWTDGVIGHG